MWKEILKKVVIATIATVFFSLALSMIAYEPKGEQHPNTSSMTFFDLFIIYVAYSAPAYLLSGVGFSLSMDSLQYGFLKGMISYTASGGAIAFVFYFVFFKGALEGIDIFVVYGMFASLLFYAIQTVLNRLFKLNEETDIPSE